MNLPEKREISFWRPGACLRVTGEDAATFLQGQFTNDLQKNGAADGVYGLWLNQKGKVLADSFVQRLGEREYRIVSYFSPVSVIRERLEAYVIADDVVVEDFTDAVSGVTIFDDASMALPPGAWSFVGRRTKEAHREVIVPRTSQTEVMSDLSGAKELTAAEVSRRRIVAGIPAVPADIGPADLPNEGGLEAEAISYTKGCYLGQEVMARLKSMGQVRRRLVRVRGEGPVPVGPTLLFQAGRKVGEVRSAAVDGSGWIGLAMVTLLAVKPAEGLALTAEGAPVVSWSESP